MAIGPAEVAQIAHLARLAVEAPEAERYARDLSDILAFVEQLSAVDAEGVSPMAHPLDMAQRLRADEVTETDQRSRFQAIAPAVEDGLYLVPRVIE